MNTLRSAVGARGGAWSVSAVVVHLMARRGCGRPTWRESLAWERLRSRCGSLPKVGRAVRFRSRLMSPPRARPFPRTRRSACPPTAWNPVWWRESGQRLCCPLERLGAARRPLDTTWLCCTLPGVWKWGGGEVEWGGVGGWHGCRGAGVGCACGLGCGSVGKVVGVEAVGGYYFESIVPGIDRQRRSSAELQHGRMCSVERLFRIFASSLSEDSKQMHVAGLLH